MALVESLINQISDPTLREKLAREMGAMKKRLSWGLVFERHLPENTRLLNAPIKVGTAVWERQASKPKRFRVRAIDGSELVVVDEPTGTTAPPDAPAFRIGRDVLVESGFDETVFPALTSLGFIRNGPVDRPSHAVIEGENYHVLEGLLAAYEGQVDCLYLDPPYNTGARDWAYNNDYVDPTDRWRPSKWLAFMERRLQLGRKLLKADGVLVVTIDENEVHHLGMLLEQMFPEALRQMATICINPSGASNEGLSRVDEYAFFVFFGGTQPTATFEDYLNESKGSARWWDGLLRGGSGWTRAARKNLCYPIFIDEKGRIAGAGERFEGEDESGRPLRDGDYELAWPVRNDGTLGIWRLEAPRLREFAQLGYAYASKRDEKRGTWSLKYLLDGAVKAIAAGELEIRGQGVWGQVLVDPKVGSKVIAKTMWHRGRHTAGGGGGTQLVTELTGQRGAFSYPKSVYAVRDTLDVAVGDRTDALICDFFAGSGTTLHATMLLNARDEGTRRCVLVTNNEVRAEIADGLNKKGYFRGDPEFEAKGVFQTATRPRVSAAVLGTRADATPLEGTYDDGREYAEGFPENVEFFRLDYLDPTAVELGLRFAELHPLLWLAAGGIGEREDIDPRSRVALPAGSPYAILFDPSGMPALLAGLADRPDVRWVFIVADSEKSFADLADTLRSTNAKPIALYRAYLEAVRGARS